MIFIAAPYSPSDRSFSPNLGAARKIEAILHMLISLDSHIVLVNTAHEYEYPAAMTVTESNIAGISFTEITPPTYSNRKLGKLLNLFDAKRVIDAVLKLGKPKLAWLYNGYAMESLLGVELQRRTGCKIIQEMEDWHFSRSRGLNPKPIIDWWFWRKAAKLSAHVFAVNKNLSDKIKFFNSSVSLFPGIVADGIASIKDDHPPFSNEDNIVTLGYFGGLSIEKGADHVVELTTILPENYRVIATGSGPLQEAFANASIKSSGKMEFHGRVNDKELVSLISRCDVILNPHSPIEHMANGVFPFKVIEAIASGRLLVSTHLPAVGLESELQGVLFVDHGLDALTHAVLGSRDWYAAHATRVTAGADSVVFRFSKEAILKTVSNLLKKSTA